MWVLLPIFIKLIKILAFSHTPKAQFPPGPGPGARLIGMKGLMAWRVPGPGFQEAAKDVAEFKSRMINLGDQ